MSENQNDVPEKKEDEIAEYFEGVKKLEIEGYETGIKKARNALFITAGLVLVGEIISIAVTGIPVTPFVIGFIAIEAGIFVALGFWTKTQPLTAIIVGLIVFIGIWIFSIVFAEGSSAFNGILVRIIIIVTLANAIKPAKAWHDAKKNM